LGLLLLFLAEMLALSKALAAYVLRFLSKSYANKNTSCASCFVNNNASFSCQ